MEGLQVGIVVGSDSDLPIMRAAGEILEELNIGHEWVIASAHRTPQKVTAYARDAIARGVKVIIAGAGGAAHLPGVLAALTSVPVIGVPIKTPALGGKDSLYSMVQMPSGIPVGIMAIDGARNAGLYAAQILGTSNVLVRERVLAYRNRLAENVEAKAEKLSLLGVQKYLDGRIEQGG